MDTYILDKNLKKSNIQPAALSKAHIRPFVSNPRIEYIQGASYIRSTKDRPTEQVGGGQRGGIKGFSHQSRRRLLELISYVKRESELPCFVTLTYPNEFPAVDRAKRDLKVFIQRIIRAFPDSGFIWKLEPQKRGAPHYHMLIWGVHQVDLFSWVVHNWYSIAGNGDYNHFLFHSGSLRGSKPCVTRVRSFRGVWSYASKYIGKTFEVAEWGSQWTGRFWGIGQRQNIPFGEKCEIEVTNRDVIEIMRYQRRFMDMRTNRDLNSLKTFCNADFWIQKLGYQAPGARDPGQGGNLAPARGVPGIGPGHLEDNP